jgi:hypothetical protein
LYKIIEHSQGKDKILKASLTQIQEAQDLKDELGREHEMNQALLARINELTGQIDAKR